MASLSDYERPVEGAPPTGRWPYQVETLLSADQMDLPGSDFLARYVNPMLASLLEGYGKPPAGWHVLLRMSVRPISPQDMERMRAAAEALEWGDDESG